MRQIPARFHIMGHEIDVRMRDDLQDDAECYGRFIMTKNLIEIQSGLPFSVTLATFWHEVVHAINAHMGMPEIDADETKVDKLGQGIAQVLRTKKGSAAS